MHPCHRAVNIRRESLPSRNLATSAEGIATAGSVMSSRACRKQAPTALTSLTDGPRGSLGGSRRYLDRAQMLWSIKLLSVQLPGGMIARLVATERALLP